MPIPLMLLMLAAGFATAATAAAHAPTEAELNNATYAGLLDLDGPITLVNGRWEGEPYAPGGASRPIVIAAPGFRLTGDLNGDGTDEAVVVLAQSSGGSGSYDYLAAVGRTDVGVRNLATVALGDRVAIRAATIEDGVLRVSVLRAGDGDARCCPGELADLAWTLSEGALVPAESAGVTERLSLDTLLNEEWLLREWQVGERAPARPEVTLIYQNGQFGGASGCNRYFATITEGDGPGDLSVGAVGATRMACPEAETAIEARYLDQLGEVAKFGFLLGRLALTFQREDGSIGTMLFEPRAR